MTARCPRRRRLAAALPADPTKHDALPLAALGVAASQRRSRGSARISDFSASAPALGFVCPLAGTVFLGGLVSVSTSDDSVVVLDEESAIDLNSVDRAVGPMEDEALGARLGARLSKRERRHLGLVGTGRASSFDRSLRANERCVLTGSCWLLLLVLLLL